MVMKNSESFTALMEKLVDSKQRAESALDLENPPLPEDNEDLDYGSESSDDTSEDVGESVRFYIDLLMKLVPSMEKAYAHSQIHMQRKNSKEGTKLSEKDNVKGKMKDAALTTTKLQDTMERQRYKTSLALDKLIAAGDNEMKEREATISSKSNVDIPEPLGEQKPTILQRLKILETLNNDHEVDAPPPYYSQTVETKFRNLLITLSSMPIKYENQDQLDQVLQVLPLDRIYKEATIESQLSKKMAKSSNGETEWGYRDLVIRALLRYATVLIFFLNHET